MHCSIKLFVCDIDGTLTDGTVLCSTYGEMAVAFNRRDGMGFRLLREAGIKTMLISAENSQIYDLRARKLQIDYIRLGVQDKVKEIEFVLNKNSWFWNVVAVIGDDINDLPAIKKSGISACPADAHPAVKKEVDYVCRRAGGRGCAREFSDYILGGCKARHTKVKRLVL